MQIQFLQTYHYYGLPNKFNGADVLIKKWLISLLTDSLLVLVKKKFYSQFRKLKPSKDAKLLQNSK